MIKLWLDLLTQSFNIETKSAFFISTLPLFFEPPSCPNFPTNLPQQSSMFNNSSLSHVSCRDGKISKFLIQLCVWKWSDMILILRTKDCNSPNSSSRGPHSLTCCSCCPDHHWSSLHWTPTPSCCSLVVILFRYHLNCRLHHSTDVAPCQASGKLTIEILGCLYQIPIISLEPRQS